MSGICGWDISVVALRHARTASSYPVHFPWTVVASKLKIIFLRSCHFHVFLIHLIGPSFNRPAFLCTSPNSQLAGTSQSIIWPFKPSTMFEHETLWKKSYSLRKMQGTRVVLWFAFFFLKEAALTWSSNSWLQGCSRIWAGGCRSYLATPVSEALTSQ